jgi:predicted metal-dependent hydrolase
MKQRTNVIPNFICIPMLDELSIPYIYKYLGTNRITLRFNKELILVISFYKGMRQEAIVAFVEKHLDWIQKNYKVLKSKQFYIIDKAKYLFLGNSCTLHLCKNNHPDVIKEGDDLYLYYKDANDLSLQLLNWEKEQADMIFQEMLYNCFQNMKSYLSTYPVLVIKQAKSCWGYLKPSKNKIMLNLSLIHVPPRLLEYVVYHELCHYVYLNHSALFHSFLQKWVPDERSLKKQLKGYLV